MNMGKSFCALWLCIIFCAFSSGAEAYVMPPEQLIDYMQDKLGAFKTVIMDQKTILMDPRDGKEVDPLRRRSGLKPPGFFESKVISGQRNGGAAGDESFPSLFRQLFMANSRQYILMLLAKFGIDVESSELCQA